LWRCCVKFVFEMHINNAHLIRHTHNRFTALFRDHLGEPVPEEILLVDFVVQGKITEADRPTIRLDATLSGLISDPPPSSSIFTPDALPAVTLPHYLGLIRQYVHNNVGSTTHFEKKLSIGFNRVRNDVRPYSYSHALN